MTAAPILAADHWPTNGHLIADVARLGFLRADLVTIDPTFGRGRWWTIFRPASLFAHDIKKDGVDFRRLPYPGGFFEQAVFDPPYVCYGGRTTNGGQMVDFLDAYGLRDAPSTPKRLHAMNADGMRELDRVTVPGGIVAVKTADYVSSGRVVDGVGMTRRVAAELEWSLVQRFEHVGRARAQPARTRKARAGEQSQDGRVASVQRHARNNSSTLLVYRTSKERKRLR